MILNDFMSKAVSGIAPGDARHQKLITASKISACTVPSRSPYESFDSLHRQLAGLVPKKEIDPALAEFGHRAEPMVAQWYQDKRPDILVFDPHLSEPMTWFNGEFFAATPDRILVTPEGAVDGLLEIKTAFHADGWGEEGTNEIPPHYYDQCQWQMFCTGVDVVYVAALIVRDFKGFVVRRDDEHIKMLRDSAEYMLGCLESEKPNLRDAAHRATYQALRAEHPLIDDSVATLDFEVARDYLRASEQVVAANVLLDAAKSRVAEQMGTAKEAVFGEFTVAVRQARGQGKPFVTKARRAPKLSELEVW